jgi:metal-responsive CopG/Arc/MetJ family transcriptional regulator
MMATTKIAITLKEETLKRIDRLVKKQAFPSRSRAIQEAVEEKLEKMDQNRLARECGKLDPAFEKALAEEGLSEELTQWPEY